MTLQQTDWLPTKSETFQSLRQMFTDLAMQQGVVGVADYQAVPRGAGANMSVDVGAGSAWIQGNSTVRQGLYHQVNDGTVNVQINTADPTNPRLDQVFLVANDSSVAGATDNPALVVVAGTPTSGATLQTATGGGRQGAVTDATIAATYPNRIRLCDVLVPANATSIVAANIMDRRSWARGYYNTLSLSGQGANLSTSSGTWVQMSTALQLRAELTGLPVRVRLSGIFNNGTAGAANFFGIFVNGTRVGRPTQIVPNSGGANADGRDLVWEFVPSAGSGLIAPYWAVTTGTATTYVSGSGAAGPYTAELEIQEIVVQNANNGTS